MSILFVLLMFLLVMSISYFRSRGEVPAQPEVWAGPPAPRLQWEYGFSIPDGYSFHPGHTWVLKEGGENARVGVDTFAANLIGKIEGVVMAVNKDVVTDPGLLARDPYQNGWIAIVKSPDLALNKKNLVQGGMVAPWLQNSVSRLNGMVSQLSPTLAADGGVPLPGLLMRVIPELREKLAREFLLA